MAEIVKPNMNTMWASGGAVIAPSNTKIQQGWTSEIPPHQWQNWWQNRVDMFLLYISQKGIPEWDNTTEYWANRSFVQRSGNLYKAIRNNTNADPLTSASDWANAIPSATTTVQGVAARATTAESVAGTNDTKFITPKTLKDKLDSPTTGYLKASNNLSDLTNASAARTNLDIRASSTVNAGLIRVATVAESTARTSEGTALSPAGLGRNIQNSRTDNTAGRLLTVGAFGLGAGTATPPNGRANLNPMGWYYVSGSNPSFGGGSFFLELPYTSTTGGMRFSCSPYKDRYYLNSWDRDNATHSPAVEIWHTGNFQASDYAIKDHTHTIAQVTGLQTALNNKQNNIGYTPVNKAGDSMTGSLTTSGDFTAAGNINGYVLRANSYGQVIVGSGNAWTTFASMDNIGIWWGNNHNRWRMYQDAAQMYITKYSGTGAYDNWAVRIGDDRTVTFSHRPTAAGLPVALLGEAPEQFSIGTYAFLGTQGGNLGPGDTANGSSLTWANASRAAMWGYVNYGTWRCLGYAEAIGGANDDARATLFVRIA